jgi:cytoskeletal protein CcmA (bactofilin family)
MTVEKTSTLLSDVSIEGDLIEKDKIILDAKVDGDIQADDIRTHSKSFVKGNIKSKNAVLGGKLNGNVNSDKIKIRSTAEIEGVLNQNILSIEEGATLKIKAETNK